MVVHLNPASGVPLYVQLIEQVKHAIETGVLRAGDQLPSVRQIAEELTINPNTVARAYRELEHEGARLKSQYEQRIAQAQTAAYAAKDVILQDARQQREKILGQARDEAAKELDQVRRDITDALEHEKRLADAEVSALARDMVSKVLGRSVA